MEVYNDGKPRLGRVVRGTSKFEEVNSFETELDEKLTGGLIRLS